MNALRRVLGMFAYYAKWVFDFAEKIRPLADVEQFPSKRLKCICVVKN